jgi:uncharacterized membrane protein
MISVSETAASAPAAAEAVTGLQSRRRKLTHRRERVNVGDNERAVSVAAGAVLAALGLRQRGLPGIMIAGIGGALAYRGVTGHSFAYDAMKVSTADRGIHAEAAFLINRSPEDLYQFWRNFANLPRIMNYLERVDVIDQNHSHWVARVAPTSVGKLEWDAEITHDEPGARIGWRSLAGADVDNVGEIRFVRAMGDRGTEVHVSLDYHPPAGNLGHWIATLFGRSPRFQMREELRNFKRLMETGEIPTIIGQPRGTCSGSGKRETE